MAGNCHAGLSNLEPTAYSSALHHRGRRDHRVNSKERILCVLRVLCGESCGIQRLRLWQILRACKDARVAAMRRRRGTARRFSSVFVQQWPAELVPERAKNLHTWPLKILRTRNPVAPPQESSSGRHHPCRIYCREAPRAAFTRQSHGLTTLKRRNEARIPLEPIRGADLQNPRQDDRRRQQIRRARPQRP